MSITKVTAIGLFLVVVGVIAPAAANAQTPGVREVTASPRTLIQLQTRLRYTTMIVLPEGEEILDVSMRPAQDLSSPMSGASQIHA